MEKSSVFLKDKITKQYPLSKFTKLIELSIDMVENFLITLEEGFNYDSTTLASYEIKYTSNYANTSSKVETLFIKNIISFIFIFFFVDIYFVIIFFICFRIIHFIIKF